MLLMKYICIFSSCLLAIMMIIYKLYIQKQKRTAKTASYLSGLTGALFLYIVSMLIFAVVIQGAANKIVLILFALSPFIIGKFATYQKENLFSFIQIFCAIISLAYICGRLL